MRLIDADALFINLDGMMEVSPTGYIHGDTVADMISDAPTVDAVPVIRCKDCKYSTDEYGDGDCYCDLSVKYIGKDWNHFCSWAERKDNERVDSSR